MRVGIVAGEASGDILGAGLINELKDRFPDIEFSGIAGPRMVAAGCNPVFPADTLAVMGLGEILRRYRELRGIREEIKRFFISHPPDIFIGIDAPDFNLDVELSLRARGIPTVHYVSPSVWAWREYRIRKIARAVDLMLTLLPFEAEYYRSRAIPVHFVGHPLADRLRPLSRESVDRLREKFGVSSQSPLIAILPGSRASEVRQLIQPFLATAAYCLALRPELQFIIPVPNHALRQLIEGVLAALPQPLPVVLIDGHSQDVMAASDVILLASGTATLEAMLLGKPMVAAYRMSRLSYWFARALLRIDRYTLPNLLAGETLIPEFIQDQVKPDEMGEAILAYLDDPDMARTLSSRFAAIRDSLAMNADAEAANAVVGLLSSPEANRA